MPNRDLTPAEMKTLDTLARECGFFRLVHALKAVAEDHAESGTAPIDADEAQAWAEELDLVGDNMGEWVQENRPDPLS